MVTNWCKAHPLSKYSMGATGGKASDGFGKEEKRPVHTCMVTRAVQGYFANAMHIGAGRRRNSLHYRSVPVRKLKLTSHDLQREGDKHWSTLECMARGEFLP